MPKWNNEMLQHLTQEQAETVASTLSAMFQAHPEIEVKVSETAIPNTEERTFTIWYSVCLWYDGMLVCSFNHPNDLERFLTVVRLLSHEKPDATYFIDGIDGGMHTGICVHCDREGLLNSFDACEGCVLAAQLDN